MLTNMYTHSNGDGEKQTLHASLKYLVTSLEFYSPRVARLTIPKVREWYSSPFFFVVEI